MHAAHWTAFDALHGGHCVVLQDVTGHFDPGAVPGTAAREGVEVMFIVGDAPGVLLIWGVPRCCGRLTLRRLAT